MRLIFMKLYQLITMKTLTGRNTRAIEKGQGLIEYALIILLIVIGVILILGLVGGGINNLYQEIINALP
jgi:pilus assembly protein Flp/PilA